MASFPVTLSFRSQYPSMSNNQKMVQDRAILRPTMADWQEVV